MEYEYYFTSISPLHLKYSLQQNFPFLNVYSSQSYLQNEFRNDDEILRLSISIDS